MTKHASTHPHRARSPDAGSLPSIDFGRFEAMLAANRCFLQFAEEMNKSIVDAIQEANASGSELTAQIARCGAPTEAAGLYNQWLCERATKFVEQSQHAAELWLRLYRAAIQSGEAVATTMTETQPAPNTQPEGRAAA